MKRTLFLICTLLCANVLLAQDDFFVNGIQYTIQRYTIDGNPIYNEVRVTGYDYYLPTELEIPEMITYNDTTYNVTEIGFQAFWGCSSLISVTIPSSVTYIRYEAFFDCSNLISVRCLSNNPPILGDDAFGNSLPITTPFYRTLFVPCGKLHNYGFSDWGNAFNGNIVEDGFYVTASANNGTSGSVIISEISCNSYNLTATANEGYEFAIWSDGNTENPRIVALSSDTTFTAIFAEINESSLIDVEDTELSFYPNPTNSKITFSSTIESIEVIDLTGRCVLTFSNAREINIESLPSGAYYLRLTNNDKAIMRKVIKE